MYFTESSLYMFFSLKLFQAAEKAIKALLFKDDYRRMNTHYLDSIALGTPSNLYDLASELQRITRYAEAMRYPDRWPAPGIPHNGYDNATASRARELAQQIVDTVKGILF